MKPESEAPGYCSECRTADPQLQADRRSAARSRICDVCLGSGRTFRYASVDPRDHSPISVTHAAPMGEPCPNCKGTGRV